MRDAGRVVCVVISLLVNRILVGRWVPVGVGYPSKYPTGTRVQKIPESPSTTPCSRICHLEIGHVCKQSGNSCNLLYMPGYYPLI